MLDLGNIKPFFFAENSSSFKIFTLMFSERSWFKSVISLDKIEFSLLTLVLFKLELLLPQIRSQPCLYSGVDTLEKWLIDT